MSNVVDPSERRRNKIIIYLSDEDLRLLEDWRFRHRMQTRNEAVRRLLERGRNSVEPVDEEDELSVCVESGRDAFHEHLRAVRYGRDGRRIFSRLGDEVDGLTSVVGAGMGGLYRFLDLALDDADVPVMVEVAQTIVEDCLYRMAGVAPPEEADPTAPMAGSEPAAG